MAREIDRRTMFGTTAAGFRVLAAERADAANDPAERCGRREGSAEEERSCPDLTKGTWEEITDEAKKQSFAKMMAETGYSGFQARHLDQWIRMQKQFQRTVEVHGYIVDSDVECGFMVSYVSGTDGAAKSRFRLGPSGVRRCTGWRRKKRVNDIMKRFYEKFETIQGPNREKYWYVSEPPHGRHLTVVPVYASLRRRQYEYPGSGGAKTVRIHYESVDQGTSVKSYLCVTS